MSKIYTFETKLQYKNYHTQTKENKQFKSKQKTICLYVTEAVSNAAVGNISQWWRKKPSDSVHKLHLHGTPDSNPNHSYQ